MTEQQLLLDCLQRLNRCGIPYMLTGSMASNYWGIPRTTHDLDFVVQLPPSAIKRFVTEFRGDFGLDEAGVRDAYQPPHQFNAIDRRSALKVDFWLLQPQPFAQEMFARRVRQVLFGEPAWLATAEGIVLHKLLWNRIMPSERQLGDAAGVVAVQEKALDLPYLRRWAVELGVTAELEKILSGEIRPKST
ncbi:MAG: hypothetical protein HZA91_01265 [Verrucomicrobia bacterium]|nr:hypothetical protein [Verrucomicrobiota bacterium]